MKHIDVALKKECGLYTRPLVGKVMGNNVWFHINYAKDHDIQIDNFLYREEIDFNPTVIRLDTKTNSVSLIECNEFDTVHEPALGKAVTFKEDGSATISLPSSNKLIYHHKWQFVCPNYRGFDYHEAKMRSYIWKSILGTDRGASSRIGRLNYWNKFLADNGLIELNELWLRNVQKYTSKQTSMNSRNAPKVFGVGEKLGLFKKDSVNLDIGGGKFESGSDYLREIGTKNVIFDPYNRECIDNLKVLIEVKRNPVQSVTISNVLNVIKEDQIKQQLIRQAYDALAPGGVLIVTVYEGSKSGIGVISKKDCWQENKRLKSYLSMITDVFRDAKTINGAIIGYKPNIQ